MIYPLSMIEFFMYFREHTSEWEEVYNYLTDDKSRFIWKNYWRGMLSGNIYFPQLFSANPYWGNDVISKLRDGESIVYAGVYQGESLDRALKLNKNIIMHGFEPDKLKYIKLCEKYKELNNVNLYNYALSDKEKEAYLIGLETPSAKIIYSENDEKNKSEKEQKIKIQSIDNIIKDEVNLIALDIEGEEINALNGSRQVIKNYHPKLAISVYHKVEHYLEIPLLIKSFSEEYKLYFRQHSAAPAESVMYAV